MAAGRLPEACRAARREVREGDPAAWIALVTVNARSPGCIASADAEALLSWARAGAEAEAWRGAAAEWLASQGRTPDALRLLDAPGHDDARMRVLVASGAGEATLDAAAVVRLRGPDVLACRLLALDALARGDLLAADEDARCGELGADAAELRRLQAEARDRAGAAAEAAEAYESLKLPIHLAALRYQVEPTDPEAARGTLAGLAGAPAALHRVWLARCTGAPVDPRDLPQLDESPDARLARALLEPAAADLDWLSGLPGSIAAAVHVQVLSARGQPDAAVARLVATIEADPASLPLRRLAQRLRVPGAAESISKLDPDHLRIRGDRGPRDTPWCGVLGPVAREPVPRGEDPVGTAVRAALALPTRAAGLDALGALSAPEREGLAALRWAVAMGSAAEPEGGQP